MDATTGTGSAGGVTSFSVGSGEGAFGNQIMDAFSIETNAAAEAVNTAITASSANPGDPSSMIAMQVAMANYSISLQVQSSVIKSIEDTAKSITQKL